LAQVVVTIFSATGFSIGAKCHVWVQIAIVETMRTLPAGRSISEEEVRPFVGQRLDVFLAAVLQRSRTQVQSLLKQGLVHLIAGGSTPDVSAVPTHLSTAVTKVVASYRLRAGDSVTIDSEPATPQHDEPSGEAIPLDIIYEDDALIALNKQPGLLVHPAAGHWSGTLVNALIHHCGQHLAGRGGQERLGIVHRLDKDTSGLMLIAKTDEVHERLSAAFAEREVKKVYRALCRKKMAVSKNPERSKSAWTDYRVLTQGELGAEVECVLHTGRTHQIRVHLSHLGHPIWGDTLYGKRTPINEVYPARQMLHAARIEIAHPLTDKLLRLEAPLPEDYATSRKLLLAEKP
jgi:23S rRNA pseudouridine1911/1915/1917 synthase